MCHSVHSHSGVHRQDVWFEIREFPTVIGTFPRGTWGRTLRKQHSIRVTGKGICVSEKNPGHIHGQFQGTKPIWPQRHGVLTFRGVVGMIFGYSPDASMELEALEYSVGKVLGSTAWHMGSAAT